MRVLITGANGALAQETIKHLLKDGYRDIVMAVRNEHKGQEAKEEILNDLGWSESVNLSVVSGFDMTDSAKITEAVAGMKELKPFDTIFLAAGFAVFADDYQFVEYQGRKIEQTVFQNLIGSHITLSELKRHGLIAKGARVVIAGGEGARGIKGLIEKPEFTSAQQFRDYIFLQSDLPKYNPMNAIGVSKFCGAIWTKKMAQMNDEFEIVWFSPGLTSGSAGLQTLPFAKRLVFGAMFGMMNLLGKSQTPGSGGRKNADCLEGKIGKHGELIGAPEGSALGGYTEQTPMNTALSDQALLDELWTILEELHGEF